jgi:hypothetical protein
MSQSSTPRDEESVARKVPHREVGKNPVLALTTHLAEEN